MFVQKKMFFLTEGPHLFVADPQSMKIESEIPW